MVEEELCENVVELRSVSDRVMTDPSDISMQLSSLDIAIQFSWKCRV